LFIVYDTKLQLNSVVIMVTTSVLMVTVSDF